MDTRLRRRGISSQAAEKLIDIPYDTRIFKKDGKDVPVAGFRERLQAAVKQYEAQNRETYKSLQEMLSQYKESLISLEEGVEYDVRSMVNNAVISQRDNEACYQSLNQIVETISAINQMPFDFDEASGQIVEEMLADLVAVNALNASNEAIKTLDDYKGDYDEITVNFYRVVGGKDKGERTREYYTEKTTKTTTFKNATARYQGVVEKIHERLSSVISHSAEAGAELARFAKEVVDVMSLWSLYQSTVKPTKKNPNPQKMWKEKPVTDAEIVDLIKGYDFYKEIADKLSFRKEEEGAAVTERKLHAMRRVLAMLRARAESIVNAPAYAAGTISEYTDSATDFAKEASQGLREVTAALYAPQLAEAPGVVDKVKDFARGLVPEQSPAMVGAAQRVKAGNGGMLSNVFWVVNLPKGKQPHSNLKFNEVFFEVDAAGFIRLIEDGTFSANTISKVTDNKDKAIAWAKNLIGKPISLEKSVPERNSVVKK